MSALPKDKWTVDSYLAFEEASEDKHEFINGEVILWGTQERVRIETHTIGGRVSALPKAKWTAETYLAFERASEESHEFIDGEVFLMGGASEEHTLVVMSTSFSLYSQLRSRPCKVYTNDMRVKIGAADYTYPDIIALCGEASLEDKHGDILLNPTVIIEVLSTSTESYDRGKKFQHYRTIESLQEYLLVSQDTPRIERYIRQDANNWLLTDAKGLDAVLGLPSIGCTLLLADIYEKVEFKTES
jgi:Uma2 family endonuclease